MILLNLGGIVSYTTVVIMVLLPQTRIFYAMARDGLLPEAFAKLHSSRNTPWISTLICGNYFGLATKKNENCIKFQVLFVLYCPDSYQSTFLVKQLRLVL